MEIREMLVAHPQQPGLALSADDAARFKRAGKRVLYISMGNASPLVKDPSLPGLHRREELRLPNLMHFANNELADASADPKGPEWHGISPAGKVLMMGWMR